MEKKSKTRDECKEKGSHSHTDLEPFWVSLNIERQDD